MSRIASTKYSGHVGTGGLQGHSVSAAYPWIIVGYGDDTWAAENACSGEKCPRRASVELAHRDLHAELVGAELAACFKRMSHALPPAGVIRRAVYRNGLIGVE